MNTSPAARRVRAFLPAIVALVVTACAGAPGPSAATVPTTAPGPSTAESPAATQTPPAATPTPPAATPTAPASTPTVPILDATVCDLGEDLAAGTYRSPYVWGKAAAITIDVPAGWRYCREDRPGGGVVGLIRGEGNEIGHAREWISFFAVPAGEDVAQLLIDLRATPLLTVGPPEELTIAGEPAIAFDATAQPNPAQAGNAEVAPGAISFPAINHIFSPHMWRSETPEARFRFIVVGHGRQGVIVYVEAPPALFDALKSDAAPIVETVEFVD